MENQNQNMPERHPHNDSEESHKGNIPTWAGVIIAVALVGAFLFFFWKSRDSQEIKSGTTVTSPVVQQGSSAGDQAPAAPATTTPVDTTTPTPPGSQPATSTSPASTIDFDYEIGKMDSEIGDTNSNNFSDDELANTELGI